MKESCNCCHSCKLNDILESIALEEAGIAHILNAEGEKIQKALACDISFEEILLLNKAVTCLITEVTNLEIALGNKIKALNCLSFVGLESQKTHCVCVQVCDLETDMPIYDASVKICCNNKIVASGNTDECGFFKACGLESGCYMLNVIAFDDEQSKCVDLCHCNGCEQKTVCFKVCCS